MEISVFAAVVFAYSLVSHRVEGTILTAPMVFVAAGLVLGSGALGLLELHLGQQTVLVVSELTLAFLLFTDAARIDLSVLRGNTALPLRLLGLGMPLTIAAGAVVGTLLVPGVTVWEAALLGTILAPTDAALGQAVVNNEHVPVRIRQALNVEAGLNDGLSMPFFSVFLTLALAGESQHSTGYWIAFALKQVGYGGLVGLAIGAGGGWLMRRATNAGWMSATYQQLGLVALPLLTYLLAGQIGGNGFIASFVAGAALSVLVKDAGDRLVAFAEETGQLLSLGVLFVFGAVASTVLGALTWQIGLYAVLSLTLVRMVPVAMALVGTRLRSTSVLFLGWFGPRGLASIVLGLLVFEEAHTLRGFDTLVQAIIATVLLSVFAHGITAAPLSNRFGRQADAWPPDAPEWGKVVEMPTRGGWGQRARRKPAQRGMEGRLSGR